jgi:CubicO group peptidase (beta-lactamase class C family)
MRHDTTVYERAVGWSNREQQLPMQTNSMFRIASQTKAITSVAIAQLMDEGRFTPGTPAAEFMPTFARSTVVARVDTGLAERPARRPIVMHDLLTHTAGISYGTDAAVAARYRAKGLGSAAGRGWYTADKSEPVCTTMDTLGTLPFVAQPGERFVYGYSTDVLGCIVERASGVPLDRYIRDRITSPLGMHDTHFFVPMADRGRLVTVYERDSTGLTPASADARGQGHYVDGPRVNFAGGAGMVSTARDYARFLQMISHGGQYAGTQILSRYSTALLTNNQLGSLRGEAVGYSYAFQTVQQFGGDGPSYPGAYGWGGAYGSSYKVDPTEGLIIVFMINQFPSPRELVDRFEQIVYGALIESAARLPE